MAKKGEYKGDASKETVRQRKKNQKPHQKKKRVARNKARREAIREGKVTKSKPEVDHHKGGTRVISHKKNRSRDNNKNHKRKA